MALAKRGAGRDRTVGNSVDNMCSPTSYWPGGIDHGPTVVTGKYSSDPIASVGVFEGGAAESAVGVRGTRLQP